MRRTLITTLWTTAALWGVAESEALAAPRDANEIGVGAYHSCAVTSCGEVKCWGRNNWGQSADRNPSVPPYDLFAPFIPEYEMVSAGQYHTCALDENGAADCWGKANYGQSADRVGPFVDLDAGWAHNCAIREGTFDLECWGTNSHSAVSSTPSGDMYQDVSAGLDYACAVVDGGDEIHCWGRNSHGQAPSVIEAPNLEAGEVFVEVSAGAYHTCGLTDWQGGETLYCWGYGPYASLAGWGQELDPGVYWLPFYDLLQVEAGTWATLTTREIGGDPQATGYGWTFDTFPIGSGTLAEDFSVGSNHWCIIESDGDIDCDGNAAYGKTTPPSMTGSCPGLFQWPWF